MSDLQPIDWLPQPLRELGSTERFYTTKQLAKLCKVSVSTIERAVRSGALMPNHFGRAVRFSLRQVEAYIRRTQHRSAG